MKTTSRVLVSEPFSLTSSLKPVTPAPPRVPTKPGWLSRCWSCAQLEKRPEVTSRVLSAVESGGSMMPTTISPAIATSPLSQKSQRASPVSFTFARFALAIDAV